MLRPLILAATIAFSAASGVFAGGSEVAVPPAAYDHAYGGRLTVLELDYWEVDRFCRRGASRPWGRRYEACAFVVGDHCTIALPRVGTGGVDVRTQARMRRHELGHCNGKRSHDGYRFAPEN